MPYSLSYSSGRTLLEYQPLEGIQAQLYGLSPSLSAMQTGPMPWIGFEVDIIRGHFKGQSGVVRQVDRYHPKHNGSTPIHSGILLTVESFLIHAGCEVRHYKVDYHDVRYAK